MDKETQTPDQGEQVKLENFLNTVVVVSVKDGRKFRGKLTQYDEHMNFILENAEETTKPGSATRHRLILLKGGNVSDVSV